MKKQLVLFLALALCLGLTACGDTESDDMQSGYETVMDMEFLDGMWRASTAPRSYTLTVRRSFTPTALAGDSADAENSSCPRRAVDR